MKTNSPASARMKIVSAALSAATLFNVVAVTPGSAASYEPAREKPSTSEIGGKLAKVQIPFIENAGQADPKIRFHGQLQNGTVFIDREGKITYKIRSSKENGYVLKESFVTDKNVTPSGEEKSAASINFFIGNDRSKWKRNVPNYRLVNLGEVFDGVTVKLKAIGKNVEKIFTVHPGANPEHIAVRIKGADSLNIGKRGELEIRTSAGILTMTAPVAWQAISGQRKNVEASYQILGNDTYGFSVGSYDTENELIIDPLLASTFLGGSASDGYQATVTMAIDTTGKIFTATDTNSTDYPATTGAYDETYNGGFTDGVISRFSANLTTLEASTFFGGTGSNEIHSMALDSANNVYVTGITTSIDFPTSGTAYDTSYNFNADAFVSKLTNDLSTLSASTFLGGFSFEEGFGIGIAPAPEKVLVTGRTQGSSFPTTAGAYDTTFGGSQDAFASKFDIDLTTLEASTFIGGTTSIGGPNSERGLKIGADAGGNIYVAGYTNESDLPVTAGAYDTTFSNVESWIGRFDSSLSGTGVALTYFGGTSYDFIKDMIITGTGIYVAGFTGSSDFPTTVGAYSGTLNGTSDGFVSELSTDLTSLTISTYFGGSGSDQAEALDFDSLGAIFISGFTDSTDLASAGAYITSFRGGFGDGFVAKLSAALNSRTAATYIGGNDYETSTDLILDSFDNVYVAGVTQSGNFPTTAGAYDRTYGGSGNDIFVSEISNDLAGTGAVPDPPTNLAATAGDLSADLTWEAPLNDGGAPLNGYTIRYGNNELCDPTTSPYTNCSSTTETATSLSIFNLGYGITYIFSVYAENDNGPSNPSNTATATPTCTEMLFDVFCGVQEISSATLTFTDIPDSFNFPGVTTGPAAQAVFNNDNAAAQPALADVVGIEDTRSSGGFELQVQASGVFTDGTPPDIPLASLFMATNVSSPVYAIPGTDAGVSCPAADCGVVYGTTVATRGVSAALDSQGGSLGSAGTFISNLGGGPLVLMDGGLAAASGRDGRMYQFVNFYLNVPAFQPEGNYAVVLTYTLLDDTL